MTRVSDFGFSSASAFPSKDPATSEPTPVFRNLRRLRPESLEGWWVVSVLVWRFFMGDAVSIQTFGPRSGQGNSDRGDGNRGYRLRVNVPWFGAYRNMASPVVVECVIEAGQSTNPKLPII